MNGIQNTISAPAKKKVDFEANLMDIPCRLERTLSTNNDTALLSVSRTVLQANFQVCSIWSRLAIVGGKMVMFYG